MSTAPISTLILEDDPDHADLLKLALSRLPELAFDTVHCSTIAEADAMTVRRNFDVVFADYWLGGETCESFLDLLRTRGGSPAVVVTTSANDEYVAASVTRAGAHRYLRKTDLSGPLLVDALRDAMRQSRNAKREDAEHSDARAALADLTPREHEVAHLIAQGLPSKQIAQRLGCAEGTVSQHRSNIIAKTKAGSVADLVRIVIRAGG